MGQCLGTLCTVDSATDNISSVYQLAGPVAVKESPRIAERDPKVIFFVFFSESYVFNLFCWETFEKKNKSKLKSKPKPMPGDTSLSLRISLGLNLSLHLSLSLKVSLRLSSHLSLRLSQSLRLSLGLSQSLRLSLCQFLSLCLWQYLNVCLYLSSRNFQVKISVNPEEENVERPCVLYSKSNEIIKKPDIFEVRIFLITGTDFLKFINF